MKHFVKEWGPLIFFFPILILSRASIWQPVKVDGHSMDSMLTDGERLVVLSTTSIDCFDIVAAKEAEDDKIKETAKRVIGMPGDTITYKNDALYVNGKKVGEDYSDEYKKVSEDDQLQDTYSYNTSFQELAESSDAFITDSGGNTELTVRVPKGQHYLLGDDRIVSKDSREVRTFFRSDIVSEVRFRFWPLSKIDFINQ